MSMTAVEHNRQRNRLFSGREICPRCRKPIEACYCAHVRPIETRTRLVLLQHPRERYVAIGTAHMASLCLTNSELLIGSDWSRSAPLARALANPERPPILLYPGEGAIDIVKSPPPGPATLVVIDGTWAQTKKVLRINPMLAALPRYAFVPERPSEYRIRKEPDDASVATIEALMYSLTALEGDEARFATLLDPFRAMIAFQIECEDKLHGARGRHAKRRARPRRMRVPRAISERLHDVVCVAGEANAWPYAARVADPTYADELVQWVAYRPASGEAMAFVVAPRGAVAPGTRLHTRLDETTLHSGGTLAELHERWRAFVRDTDVVCSWGRYEMNLFGATGGWLPTGHLDLRRVAREVSGGNVGTLAQYSESIERDREATMTEEATAVSTATAAAMVPSLIHIPGRAGDKLRAIAAIVSSFAAVASARS